MSKWANCSGLSFDSPDTDLLLHIRTMRGGSGVGVGRVRESTSALLADVTVRGLTLPKGRLPPCEEEAMP